MLFSTSFYAQMQVFNLVAQSYGNCKHAKQKNVLLSEFKSRELLIFPEIWKEDDSQNNYEQVHQARQPG